MKQAALRRVVEVLQAARVNLASHEATAKVIVEELEAMNTCSFQPVDDELLKRQFNAGVLIAASTLQAQHDQPTMASDMLRDMGLNGYDCKPLDLTDFDKQNLRKICRWGNGLKLKGIWRNTDSAAIQTLSATGPDSEPPRSET